MEYLKRLPILLLTAILTISFFSCTADEEITKAPVTEDYLKEARAIILDSLVLNAHAMQGTVSKTLLPTGCPLKYHFKWKSDDELTLQLLAFQVGRMPFEIWFTINCKFIQLNAWEKQEYKGEGWIKLQGTGGNTIYNSNTEDYESGDGGGGSVTGFLNVKTKEIEFVTNFNVMNMSSDVFRQKIDHSRMERFEEEFAQYEKDLAQYKKDHGII